MATPLKKIVRRSADGFVITLEPNPAGKALLAIRQKRRHTTFYLTFDLIYSAAVKATLRGGEPVKRVARKSEIKPRR